MLGCLVELGDISDGCSLYVVEVAFEGVFVRVDLERRSVGCLVHLGRSLVSGSGGGERRSCSRRDWLVCCR